MVIVLVVSSFSLVLEGGGVAQWYPQKIAECLFFLGGGGGYHSSERGMV